MNEKEGWGKEKNKKGGMQDTQSQRRTKERDLWIRAINYNGLKKQIYLNGNRPRFGKAITQPTVRAKWTAT
jgi:hypothetical protein